MRNRVDVPLATGLLKVGAQIYRNDALDLRLEYGLGTLDSCSADCPPIGSVWSPPSASVHEHLSPVW